MLAVRELGGFLGKEGVATGVTREEGMCVCVCVRMCVYHFFIYTSVDGYLSSFHVLAIQESLLIYNAVSVKAIASFLDAFLMYIRFLTVTQTRLSKGSLLLPCEFFQ